MYFPSDSWYKFREKSLPGMCNNFGKSDSANRNIMEVHQAMPIANPNNPNEMDHIDLSLLERVIIEPENVYCFGRRNKFKIEFSLKRHPEKVDWILYAAKYPDGAEDAIPFTVQQLEEAVSYIVHKEQSKRIEQVPPFDQATVDLINRYLDKKKGEGDLHLRMGQTYRFENGLGIVYDKKAEQEIGTFERVEITLHKTLTDMHIEYLMHDIILSLRSEKDLAEDEDRFIFRFYNLDDNLIYVFDPKGKAVSTLRSDIQADCTLKLNMRDVHIEAIEDNDAKLPLIIDAQNTKTLVLGDPNDPLYQEDYERFKDVRMSIIRSSQEKAKKEKMVSLFADIEL
jgi:hypothetical protein